MNLRHMNLRGLPFSIRARPRKLLVVCFIFFVFCAHCEIIFGKEEDEALTSGYDDVHLDGDEDDGEKEETSDVETNNKAGCALERDLGSGWTEYFDSDRRVMYYHNDQSGVTQWNFPITSNSKIQIK